MIYTDAGSVPDMRVVTFGSGTAICAAVVGNCTEEVVTFILSGDAESAGSALERLLDVTQRMLNKRWSVDVYKPCDAVWRAYGGGGGYYHYEGNGSNN